MSNGKQVLARGPAKRIARCMPQFASVEPRNLGTKNRCGLRIRLFDGRIMDLELDPATARHIVDTFNLRGGP